MRLLHVLAELGYSGGELQLEYLLAHLQRRGHDNHLILAPQAKFAAVAARLGIPVTEVDLRRPLRPGTGARLRAAVAQARPDVLHFGCGRSLLWGGWFARRGGVRLRVTTRRIDYPIGRYWRGLRYRHLVDHVVANCAAVRQRVLEAGVPPDRVSLVHEGIELAPWQGLTAHRVPARQRLNLPANALVISCAATLRPRKGQRSLLHAFAAIADRFPQALLVLAGTGSDQAALTILAGRLGLAQRVLLPGAIRPVQDLYAASDLFVMPSRNEGLANACLEASAAGLPLVVTSAGGLPEIVEHGRTGSVVGIGDIEALATAMTRYLADSNLRASHGQAGAARTADLFSEQKMADTMEALFERLLKHAAP